MLLKRNNMPRTKGSKTKKPKRDWVDELFEFLSQVDPHETTPPVTYVMPLEKSREFRDGDEGTATVTFLCGERGRGMDIRNSAFALRKLMGKDEGETEGE